MLRATLQATRITARHALERTLQQVEAAPIGVISPQSSAVVEWLRHSGRVAEPITALRKHQGHKRTDRPERRSVIVAVDCVEYAPDPTEFLRELRRHITPDGRLVAVVPNLTHAGVRLALLRGEYPLSPVGAPHARRPFTAAEIERLLEDAGFAVIGVERELESVEVLKEIGTGVPEPVLAVLADDTDALTSHFAVLAGPQGAVSTGLLHRRVRDLASEQHAISRTADQLVRRIARLEARRDGRSVETVDMPGITSTSRSTIESERTLPAQQDLGRDRERLGRAVTEVDQHARSTQEQHDRERAEITNALTAIERLDQELRQANARLAARAAADAERDAVLRHAREQVLTCVGAMTSLITRVEQSCYRRLVSRVCKAVNREVTRGSVVAVITRGDHELLAFDRREGWHFPQTEKGVYAGHHPEHSEAAITHLEHLRSKGARYLVIPRTSFWWLEHYREFKEHLLRRYRCVLRDDRTCMLFALKRTGGSGHPALRRRESESPPPGRRGSQERLAHRRGAR